MSNQKEVYTAVFLAGVLEDFNKINKSDTYQVYALYRLIDCECSACGKNLEFPVLLDDQPTGKWATETARFIREAGWFLSPENAGSYDLNALCPDCLKAAERSQRPQ